MSVRRVTAVTYFQRASCKFSQPWRSQTLTEKPFLLCVSSQTALLALPYLPVICLISDPPSEKQPKVGNGHKTQTEIDTELEKNKYECVRNKGLPSLAATLFRDPI